MYGCGLLFCQSFAVGSVDSLDLEGNVEWLMLSSCAGGGILVWSCGVICHACLSHFGNQKCTQIAPFERGAVGS